MRRISLPLTLLCAFFLQACGEADTISLSREDLFTLNLGKMENQFDYFFSPYTNGRARNYVYYDDGMFYIINGNSQKVMEFSLLGELTRLFYNPLKNPTPVLLKTERPKSSSYDIVSRLAVPVPFMDIGAFGVDQQKNIYLEDQIKVEPAAEADPAAATFRKIIKRFDRLGNFIDTIGRTGRGGLPFPAIEEFFLTDSNHLVVVCKTAHGSTVYWLDDNASLLYEVYFDYANLPVPSHSDVIPTLGKIVPDFRSRTLYVMLSYYGNVIDDSSRLVSRVNHLESRIYTFDLEKEKYSSQFVSIPAESGQSDPLFSREKQAAPLPYHLLGVSDSQSFFLFKMRNKTTYELLVIGAADHAVKRIRIFIDDTDMVAIDFHIAKNGLLYALIAEHTRARIVRWRSDLAVAGIL